MDVQAEQARQMGFCCTALLKGDYKVISVNHCRVSTIEQVRYYRVTSTVVALFTTKHLHDFTPAGSPAQEVTTE
jgi:hypothetical protein